MNETDLITLLDYLGTFAFAISGIRLAAAKRFDWFGAYVVGLVTAIGGGTIRDILLDTPPFWMQQPSYLVVTGIAGAFVILLRKYIVKLSNTFFVFDTIGLGLFTVVGIEKALHTQHPYWIAAIMGMITAVAGGIIRDILINEEPLIFRKDIYAVASLIGGIAYYLCATLETFSAFTQIIVLSIVITVRLIAVKYHLGLPSLKAIEN